MGLYIGFRNGNKKALGSVCHDTWMVIHAMEVMKDALPFTAILIVLISMAYTNIIIIGNIGRMTSFIPILGVILIWLIAILKTRGDNNVQ